jgi:hypothetical protein
MIKTFNVNITIYLLLIIFLISCKNSSTKNESEHSTKKIIDRQEYLDKGKSIAMATKKALAEKLIHAIETKGTDQALAFCNIEAIPLTDSMSNELSVNIKRVSDRYRNPKNEANEMELAYIENAKIELANHGKAKPEIIEMKESIIGYYPIVTNALCLQCHGNFENDIDAKTKTAIHQNYPHDLATGYSINELRGIWVIEF